MKVVSKVSGSLKGILSLQDAAEAKAEEEAKSKAEAEAGGDEDEEETLAAKLVARVHSVFDLPALAPYRGLAQPLFDLLEHHEATVFLVLAAPGLLILFLLFTLLGLLGISKVSARNCAWRR